MRHARASLLLVVLAAGAARAQDVTPVAPPPRAAVLEWAEEWTERRTGAARALEQAGFAPVPLDTRRPATALGVDLIVFGSFCSEAPAYREYVAAHGPSLAEFVAAGGVVLQLTQADQTEASVPWLPEGLSASRVDEDLKQALVRAPGHPLLEGFQGALPLPTHVGRPPVWESLSRFEGFRVLVAGDPEERRPALLEAAHGRGRVLLSALFLDKLYTPRGDLDAPDAFVHTSARFFRNLRAYVLLVRAGQAPPITPSEPHREPAPLPWVPGSFTIAVLPDTQYYAERWPSHFLRQTEWLRANARARNIVYALHLGDVTNRNTPQQWQVARQAMSRLEGVVPYALVPGNHDYGPGGDASSRETLLNEYFHADEQARWPTFGGVFQSGRLDNSYHLFTAGEADWLVLALEWGPRAEVVAWANDVVARHPGRRVILVTHAYLFNDGTRYDWATKGARQPWNPHAYGTAKLPGGSHDGEGLWQALVRRHAGFTLTLNGHVLGDGLGLLRSEGDGGNVVHQMLVNFQMHKEGGEGYLRLLEFLPDGVTVQVKTYSPSLDAYKTDPENQLLLELSPPLGARR